MSEIKNNPYSDRLRAALEAVREAENPDYLTVPYTPTDAMIAAACKATGLEPSQVYAAYQALITAWLEQE